MSTVILSTPQVYQAPENVIINHRVHYFHYFLPHESIVMDQSWPLVMDNICKSKKPCLHVQKKQGKKK